MINFINKQSKKQGVSNYSIAEKTGLDISTIGRIKKGTHKKPAYESIAKILKALGFGLVARQL